MKVTQVAICPSDASRKAGRPALTPELLAASGARYSRNNEGLDSILSRIDPENLEKSVDSIFRMVDYGHQSIADMVPVAIFMDGLSIWLAYYLWTLCPTAAGQESSTRYIKIALDGLIPPDQLGIPEPDVSEWIEAMKKSFEAYQSALLLWEDLASRNPELMGIPKSLQEDSAEMARKKVQRMKRNYAFDRARYFLPVAAATNVMMVMSARGWVSLCQYLLSHPLKEPNSLGELIRAELEIAAPRMTKYARRDESTRQAIDSDFQKWVLESQQGQAFANKATPENASPAVPFLSFMSPEDTRPETISQDLSYHVNRYAPMGSSLRRMSVRFGWPAISFAEIRDLNRHRTGSKYCPLIPQGFYHASDQIPPSSPEAVKAQLLQLAEIGKQANAKALQGLRQSDYSYLYWSLLGTEYPFEHVTTADKFIYEAELRTGLGAHYRYAKHLRDVLSLFYQHFPASKGLILEGSAEPE